MDYRKLKQPEIEQLIAQGCQAGDWNTVEVVTNFKTDTIHHVYFNGKIKLGYFDSSIEVDEGTVRPTGLQNVYLKNCTIKDNVYISDVKSLVNYTIEDNVVIENVTRLLVSGETTFGNGLEVDVLNEGGGREVPIFDKLTAQIAYLLATYRHDLEFIGNLKKIISGYVQSKKAKTGTIDKGSIIRDCGSIKNVNIGSYARISGAIELTEGTIVSNQNAPTTIGSGVIAKSFIIHSGSKVNNAALLDKTFVGQGVQVGRQFSAENTLIFANSECFHSEACSIFAGPYTVTHHKSTLLIAAIFSFYNAGSGSNQSNHMYKLGPIHQGILERGAKTGSFSYLLWPSRIGAFSVVIGKHYSNFDNTNLPFSYILESDGKTITIPALNFFTVGTKRDSVKWPKRDRRRDPNKLDILNFELLTPYIIGKVIKAEAILQTLKNELKIDEKFIYFEGQFIESRRIDKSLQDYQTIIDMFIGEQVIRRLTHVAETDSFEKLMSFISQHTDVISNNWLDIAGLICPSDKIRSLSEKIKTLSINSLEMLYDFLNEVHSDYDDLSWAWCLNLISDRYHINSDMLPKQTLIDIISSWKKASIEVNQRILEDAGKEFSRKSRIGYGIDGESDIVDRDFENVIGRFEENSFVKSLKEESEEINKRADKLVSFIKSLND